MLAHCPGLFNHRNASLFCFFVLLLRHRSVRNRGEKLEPLSLTRRAHCGSTPYYDSISFFLLFPSSPLYLSSARCASFPIAMWVCRWIAALLPVQRECAAAVGNASTVSKKEEEGEERKGAGEMLMSCPIRYPYLWSGNISCPSLPCSDAVGVNFVPCMRSSSTLLVCRVYITFLLEHEHHHTLLVPPLATLQILYIYTTDKGDSQSIYEPASLPGL